MKMALFVFILRLYNYEPLTPLRMLRASVFGRLVCVKGTVVRVSSIRPFCTRLAFQCLGCSHRQSLPLQHGKYATPTKVCPHNHRSVITNFVTYRLICFKQTILNKLSLRSLLFKVISADLICTKQNVQGD